MTVTTEAFRELVDSHDAADLPSLSSVLVRFLQLPADLAIGEVAEITGVSAHTLRYYERIGLVEVDRDAGGGEQSDPRIQQAQRGNWQPNKPAQRAECARSNGRQHVTRILGRG